MLFLMLFGPFLKHLAFWKFLTDLRAVCPFSEHPALRIFADFLVFATLRTDDDNSQQFVKRIYFSKTNTKQTIDKFSEMVIRVVSFYTKQY